MQIAKPKDAEAAIPAIGAGGAYAIGALLAVFGISVSSIDAATLERAWNDFCNTGLGVSSGISGTAEEIAESATELYGLLEAWGAEGRIKLDELYANSMLCDILAAFNAYMLAAESAAVYSGTYLFDGKEIPLNLVSGPLSGTNAAINSNGKNQEIIPYVQGYYEGVLWCMTTNSTTPVLGNYEFTVRPSIPDIECNMWGNRYAEYAFDEALGVWVSPYSTKGKAYYDILDDARSYLYRLYENGVFHDLSFLGTTNITLGSAYWDATQQIWTDKTGVTDNPDVNLGRDWYDDAVEQADWLNPGSATVIGNDAVFNPDGSIAYPGSITIPQDLGDTSSWQDALDKTNSGVIDKPYSDANVADDAYVGTGEGVITQPVTDSLTPGSGTSLDPNKSESSSNRPWDKLMDPSIFLIFPFCLAWDLVEIIKMLSAEPVAPRFEVPINSPVGNNNVVVDLETFSTVAAILRTFQLLLVAVGLIFLTKKMIQN